MSRCAYPDRGPGGSGRTLFRSVEAPECAARIDRVAWRATRTPDGPATVHLTLSAATASLQAEAWGEGADWIIERSPGSPALRRRCERVRSPRRRDPRSAPTDARRSPHPDRPANRGPDPRRPRAEGGGRERRAASISVDRSLAEPAPGPAGLAPATRARRGGDAPLSRSIRSAWKSAAVTLHSASRRRPQ